MNIPILICLRHQMGANVWQSELVSHRKSNLRDLWFSFLVHTCKSESHLHVTCRVNWHGCTNFILHCELCICDTTYRLLLVQTGYTQEIYSLYKRCKYVYLKYVWRRWIKITFFHIHTAASYSFMPQTPVRCTCLRGFFFFFSLLQESLRTALHHGVCTLSHFPHCFQFHPRERIIKKLSLSPSLPPLYSSLTFA